MSLTDGYTFQYTSTGAILNTASVTPFVDVIRVIGLDNPAFRETVRDHEGTDGGFLDAEFEMAREIQLEGVIYCSTSSIETFLDVLKLNFAPTSVAKPFFIADEQTNVRQVFAKSRGIHYDWSQFRRTGQIPFQLGLYAEDPRIYSGIQKSVNIPFGVQVFTGLSFNLAFNFGFGGTIGTGDGAEIINAGNRRAPAILTISGPSTDPQVISDTVGVTMKFSLDVPSGSNLVIDLGNRTVKLDSANRRGTLLAPNWFLLEPGSNFLRYRAVVGTGTSMTVAWFDAWR